MGHGGGGGGGADGKMGKKWWPQGVVENCIGWSHNYCPLGRRPRGSTGDYYMSRWSLWGAEGGWADVGLWVAVCFLAKISSHRPTCKTTFARLTQSQAISQSFRVFIIFRSMRDTTFFHFSKLFFIQNYRFLYHGDQKISWWSMQVAGSHLRNPPVKFRQERWLHIWRSISIQHVQMEAGLNSDPGNDSFWDKIRDAKHVDWSTHQYNVM